jgi:hypothetical protein
MDENIGGLIGMPDGRILKTHGEDECSGTPCVLHSPSDHPLKNAPLNWRSERAMMERICEHGIAHPDPDDRAHWERRLGGDPASREFIEARAQHTCDGCCSGTYGQPNELQKLQEIVEQYGNAWVDGTREFGPFKHLPDGGELRIVDALEVVLRTMRFAQDRGFATVSIDLLTEAIGYSFSDAKWTDEAINYRNETP